MRSYRRWLPVIWAMTIAMVLSAAMTLQRWPTGKSLLPFLPGWHVLWIAQGLGLFFSINAAGALWATRRWHQVRVARGAALHSIVLVSLAFPALFWGGYWLAYLILIWFTPAMRIDTALPILVYGSQVLASALGARVVAATLARVTGTVERPLRRAMVVWAALWPFVLPVVNRGIGRGGLGGLVYRLFYDVLSPGTVLAWQLPIGLASAAWFLRAGPARAARNPSNATASLR